MSDKKFKVGDKVRYIGKDHKEMPKFYPEIGTIGTVVKEGGHADWYIQWTKGSTSRKDCWYCDENDIELVENEDMTNEEIWKMLEGKMRKNGLKPCGSRLLFTNGIANVYAWEDVHNAIALAYKVGYLRAIKGRPFKIGGNKTGHSELKEEKTGHWVPVDPNNLPKEGTKVRYSRESKEYSIEKEPMIAIGDIGEFSYGKTLGLPGIRFNDGRFWNWVSFNNEPECLDMWVEDDE